MATKSRGFALNSEAYERFRAWCEEHGITESATVSQAIEAYTGIEMPYRKPGRPPILRKPHDAENEIARGLAATLRKSGVNARDRNGTVTVESTDGSGISEGVVGPSSGDEPVRDPSTDRR